MRTFSSSPKAACFPGRTAGLVDFAHNSAVAQGDVYGGAPNIVSGEVLKHRATSNRRGKRRESEAAAAIRREIGVRLY